MSDVNRRYETANGLAADIQRHLDNEPVVACPPSAAYRMQKAIRRNKIQFAAATFTITGLFTNLPGATSPFTNPLAAPRQFFRLKEN